MSIYQCSWYPIICNGILFTQHQPDAAFNCCEAEWGHGVVFLVMPLVTFDDSARLPAITLPKPCMQTALSAGLCAQQISSFTDQHQGTRGDTGSSAERRALSF